MILETLFQKIPFAQIISRPQTKISGVATDSNMVEPGDLFIPVIGEHHNGYKFINQALEKGAAAVAGDDIRVRRNHLACVHLPNAAGCVPFLSAAVYGHPSRMMKVVGVTGTNGKTITSHIIEAFLRAEYDNLAGYIGTTGYRWSKSHQDAKYTTPPAPMTQRIFRKMVDSGIKAVVVECSSHGMIQGRMDFTQFDAAVFTNLTTDHMDYHQNYVSYRNAKWKLFSSLLVDSEKKDKFAIFNIDDSTGRSWAREDLPRVQTITYSTTSKSSADVFAESHQLYADAVVARIKTPDETFDIKIPMIGLFNLQNVLAAFSLAHAFGMDMNRMKEIVSKGIFIPGRLEKIQGTGDIQVFIDYAQNEGSFSDVLQFLQSVKKNKVITVFGCGGNRNQNRRPAIGKTVTEKSDVTIVTTDNPRDEDPEKIIDEIFTGIDPALQTKKQILRITQRQEAITKALSLAIHGDIVLIAGKGHENYQEVVGSRIPFEDRKIVKEWFKK